MMEDYCWGGKDDIRIYKVCFEGKKPVLLNGPATVDWILKNFDEEHDFTKQILKFHEDHSDYLEYIRGDNIFKPMLLKP